MNALHAKSNDLQSGAGLEAALQGTLIRPGDPAYHEARHVWNGMIDRKPALIVRPIGVEDVVTAVNYARESGMLLSVRGGGHNVAGHATNDGGLVIDLSLMNRVTVDPGTRRVRAGGGTTIGQLDKATQEHGLAVAEVRLLRSRTTLAQAFLDAWRVGRTPLLSAERLRTSALQRSGWRRAK